MVRVSEVHTDGLTAKTYLAAFGRPDLDLLLHEVVGRPFLVDYRRHSHDAFLCSVGLRGSRRRILAAKLACVSCERFGLHRTVFDWYAAGDGDRIKDGHSNKFRGSGRSGR